MRYYIGLDLAQTQDYTALSVLERITREDVKPEYHGRHLQRFPKQTPYTAIVENVRERIDALHSNYVLIVDQTGVGRPVVDMIREAGLRTVAVTIIGAGEANRLSWHEWHVPKVDLVSVMAVLFQTGRVKFAAALPEVQTLVNELMNFQVKITAAANPTFGAWRENTHDDLVLSCALACWYAEVASASDWLIT